MIGRGLRPRETPRERCAALKATPFSALCHCAREMPMRSCSLCDTPRRSKGASDGGPPLSGQRFSPRAIDLTSRPISAAEKQSGTVI